MHIEPTTGPLGAIVGGVDLRDESDQPALSAIRSGLQAHLLLIFRGHEPPSDAQLVRFAATLGEVGDFGSSDKVRPCCSAIVRISNTAENGKIGSAGTHALPWHTDLFYDRLRQFQMLDALELPADGGATYWADTYSAFERLPPAERDRLSGLRVVREGQGETRYHHSVHPLVVTDPDSGRRALYLTQMFSTRVPELSGAESDELLARLCAHATTPDLVYRHDWTVGDLVVWDGIGTMHRRDAFDSSTRRYLRGLCTLRKDEAR
ncbi:MAG: TauD/TfdA dioxygenase family protein [Pseudonocardiaceae bacterium]